MADATAITCVVADDHPAVLEAVAEFLSQSGVEVVARARDGVEALERIEQRKPQVALVDVRMPNLGGIELTRRAKRSAPDTAILLYTGYGDRALLTEALDAGVAGFIQKEAPMDDLVRAVQSVAAGGTYVDPVLAGTLATSSSFGTIATMSSEWIGWNSLGASACTATGCPASIIARWNIGQPPPSPYGTLSRAIVVGRFHRRAPCRATASAAILQME